MDGKLWIYGGLLLANTSKYLNDLLTYNIERAEWIRVPFESATDKSFRPHPLAYHTMTPVFSKKVASSDGVLQSFSGSRFDKLNVTDAFNTDSI